MIEPPINADVETALANLMVGVGIGSVIAASIAYWQDLRKK